MFCPSLVTLNSVWQTSPLKASNAEFDQYSLPRPPSTPVKPCGGSIFLSVVPATLPMVMTYTWLIDHLLWHRRACQCEWGWHSWAKKPLLSGLSSLPGSVECQEANLGFRKGWDEEDWLGSCQGVSDPERSQLQPELVRVHSSRTQNAELL